MYALVVIASAPAPLTYAADFAVQPGDLVEVPFRTRTVAALVVALSEETPSYAVKPLKAVLRRGVLTTWQIELVSFITKTYVAHIGKTLRLFVPERIWNNQPLQKKVKLPVINPLPRPEHQLNSEQQKAVEIIINGKAKTYLLHGITGSGKTEVYLRVIQENLARGKSAVLLVPEIALTPQLTGYFAARIPPEQIAVIHSNLATGVKIALWEKIHAGEIRLVIGSRSALFAPLADPGVIILDEEHEWTYKNDQTPRYHARTVAQKLAELTSSQLIFGSATPSFESFAEAKAGKITLIELPGRATAASLPSVTVVDLKEEIKKQNPSLFSELLIAKIQERLVRGEQTILLLNKRGFSPTTLCQDCGTALTCPHCAVTLTTHRHPTGGKLLCHLCGYLGTMPRACPACGGLRLKELGTGTQRIETELATLFPKVKVLRADRDTTAARGSVDKIFHAFKKGEADILIGTQIVAKGLDLPNVTLVGVLLADVGLHLPDFRAGEKTFALLTQVAGRAGRAEKPGEVVIQTFSPEHPAVRFAVRHDYLGFFNTEIRERRSFHYPPFTRIVKFDFVGKTEKAAKMAAEKFFSELKNSPLAPLKRGGLGGADMLALAPALISKAHNKYHYHVLWRGKNPAEFLGAITLPKECRIDVDPVGI